MTTAKMEFSLGYNMKIVIKWGDQALMRGGGDIFRVAGEWAKLRLVGGGGTHPIPPVEKTLKFVHQKSGYNMQRLNQVLPLSTP